MLRARHHRFGGAQGEGGLRGHSKSSDTFAPEVVPFPHAPLVQHGRPLQSGRPLHAPRPAQAAAGALAFTQEEVAELYQQHTDDTGQRFLPEAIARAFYWTRGQPWLVNALARQGVTRLVTDRREPITAAHVEAAKELLIQRQDTHLDSLAERLREPRVRRIIAPMLAGLSLGDVPQDDLRYVQEEGRRWGGTPNYPRLFVIGNTASQKPRTSQLPIHWSPSFS